MAVKKQTKGRGKAPAKTPAKKKSTPRKKAGSGKKAGKTSNTFNLGHEVKKAGLGIAILLAVCLTVAMLADIFIKSGRDMPAPLPETETQAPETKKPSKKLATPKHKMTPVVDTLSPPETKKKTTGLKKKSEPSIVYEIFDDVDPGHAKKPSAPANIGPQVPQIAIIIDDIGYDKRLAMALFEVDPGITFSILPFSPYGKTIARKLSAKGAELMLHLPMEPTEYPRVNPGPGALLSSMSPDALLKQLRKDLDAVPGVVGVNNHMGSKLTAESDKMHQIFTVLKTKNLFFIDSRTSPDSKGEAAARLFMLRFSHRDIFLDNFQNVEYITGQFKKLVKAAHRHGTAIGIGHPYQATLDTLRIELPKLKNKVQVVRASRLVAIPG
ncbi:MAG: divergent polysaccharide deacetylase family protein [Desulfobacter sp.]